MRVFRILPILGDTFAQFGDTAAPKGCTTAHIEGVPLLGPGDCTSEFKTQNTIYSVKSKGSSVWTPKPQFLTEVIK